MINNGEDEECICPRFRDTGGFRIADLTCPTHGLSGTDPGDGYWPDVDDSGSHPESGQS